MKGVSQWEIRSTRHFSRVAPFSASCGVVTVRRPASQGGPTPRDPPPRTSSPPSSGLFYLHALSLSVSLSPAGNRKETATRSWNKDPTGKRARERHRETTQRSRSPPRFPSSTPSARDSAEWRTRKKREKVNSGEIESSSSWNDDDRKKRRSHPLDISDNAISASYVHGEASRCERVFNFF